MKRVKNKTKIYLSLYYKDRGFFPHTDVENKHLTIWLSDYLTALPSTETFSCKRFQAWNKVPECSEKVPRVLDIAFLRQYFCTCHPEDIFPVIQRSFSANEAFRGKTKCLSVLSEGSSVPWTTESEGSRKQTRGCTRDPSLRSGWQSRDKRNSVRLRVLSSEKIRNHKS